MTFTEANTVEQMILDAVTRPGRRPSASREEPPGYRDSLGRELRRPAGITCPPPSSPRRAAT